MIEFLRWSTQADADTSLAAVEAIYGLPFSDGDYVMNDWADVTQSDTTGEWGFYKPQVMLGKLQVDLMAACEAGYTETAAMPDDWIGEGGGGGELTFQQGVDSYTGAISVQLYALLRQDMGIETHYMRYGFPTRYYNLEYFDLGDLSGYGDVISATLTLFNVNGGGIFVETDIYVRQILDPDDLGGAYPTGWKIGDGWRGGAIAESRDDTTIPDIKWQNSDPGSPDDLGADYFINVLKSIAESNSYHPVDGDTIDEIYEIDVTTDVAEWKSGAKPNQGWALFHEDDAAILTDVTATSNYIADATKRPKLVIVFEGS